jgi:hypothetical protein
MRRLAFLIAWVATGLAPVAVPASTGWVERLVVEPPPPIREATADGMVFRCDPDGPPAPGGEPDLPVLVRPLSGQPGYRATASVVDAKFRDEGPVRVAPATSLRRELVEDNRYKTEQVRERNPAIYGRADFWPPSLVRVDEAWMGTNRVARLVCRPLQWNPQSGVLRVYSRLLVEIVYEPDAERAGTN